MEAYTVSFSVTGDNEAGLRSVARAEVGEEILRVLAIKPIA